MSRSYKKTPVINYERRDYSLANRYFRRQKDVEPTSAKAHYRRYCFDYGWKYIWTKKEAIKKYETQKMIAKIGKNSFNAPFYWLAKEFINKYPTLESYLHYWRKCCYYK